MGANGCVLGSISTTVTFEAKGSDRGVEGCQDDNEDAEGDWTNSSNVSAGDGEVVSDGVGSWKCEKGGSGEW